MDIRKIFVAASEHLLVEFRKTAEVAHAGGRGALREDAFCQFLGEYLPTRYAVGRGEVVTPENRHSGQLDIVIYDPSHCPALVTSTSHAVYPIESVYGAISLKSRLTSDELKDAYQNIASLKGILLKRSFQHNPTPGFAVGLPDPVPVTGVVAYASDRSLEAIAAQGKALDGGLSDITLRPDFIAVIGEGIIAPRESFRGGFNKYKLPENMDEFVQLRKTGRHTLLRLYMQILQNLNFVTLRPLNLQDYDNMPRLIGPYRVGHHNRFASVPLDRSDQGYVWRLTEAAITEIVTKSRPVTLGENLKHMIGEVPVVGGNMLDLDEIIYEYNPNNLPPIQMDNSIQYDSAGHPYLRSDVFHPTPIVINGKNYSVHVSSLPKEYFENDPDFTVDELLSS